MYTRRQVTDHVTKMNKDLYDNLQDGIDEAKSSIEEVSNDLSGFKKDVDSANGVISSNDDIFSKDKEYKAGDLVIQNNTLYVFKEDKEPSVEWNEDIVERATLFKEFYTLKNKVPQFLRYKIQKRLSISANSSSSTTITLPAVEGYEILSVTPFITESRPLIFYSYYPDVYKYSVGFWNSPCGETITANVGVVAVYVSTKVNELA